MAAHRHRCFRGVGRGGRAGGAGEKTIGRFGRDECRDGRG